MSDDQELFDAIYRLQHVFRKHNIEPICTIVLKDSQALFELESYVKSLPMNITVSVLKPELLGDEAHMGCEIMGIKFCYPAQMRAERKGGFKFE